MNNFQFLRDYQELQHTIMFDRLIDLPFGRIGFCKGDRSDFWNQILVNQELTQDQLVLVEAKFQELKRPPAIYFENRATLNSLADYLLKRGYQHSFEDCWLFHEAKKISTDRFSQVQKVLTERELKLFMKTFDMCFQKDDPQNPYGELGDYLKVAEKAWYQHHASGRIEYYTVFNNNEPVAVSTLTNFNKIGYISNVGSLRKVRGRGFGKLATLYCVEVSQKKGNQYHCLATEERTYPHEFYQRIGFVKKFSAVCYKKA